MNTPQAKTPMARRFRGFLPVIVDVETGGFNARTDALLEIAAVTIQIDDSGWLHPHKSFQCHVEAFEGANIEAAALAVNGIVPDSPLRGALPEAEALKTIFRPIRKAIKDNGCNRAILVGHNAPFDLGFLNAAVERSGIKRNPFHPFSSLDTVTLGALAYGQTVLSRVVQAAGLPWNENEAHSALYDAQRTAEVFCMVHNRWKELTDGERRG